MIKHRIMSAATLLGGVVFTGHAVAQSPEVARRLDAKYDVVWPAADGLIRVNKGGYRIPDSRMKSNGKYGYADTLGQVVVPPAYDDAADFGNGHAVVGRKAGDGRMLYGLIDRSGRVVVPLEWERLGGVRDGGCVARTGTAAEREFSLADTLGYVRSLGYDYCSDFPTGSPAWVSVPMSRRKTWRGLRSGMRTNSAGSSGISLRMAESLFLCSSTTPGISRRTGWPRSAFRENTMSMGVHRQVGATGRAVQLLQCRGVPGRPGRSEQGRCGREIGLRLYRPQREGGNPLSVRHGFGLPLCQHMGRHGAGR